MSILKNAVTNNLGVKSGGSKKTQEMFLEASLLYDAYTKEGTVAYSMKYILEGN